MTENLSVLYVGPMWEGSTTKMRFGVMQDLCRKVIAIDSAPAISPKGIKRFYSRVLNRLGYPADHADINRSILESDLGSYDILWIDAPRLISAETLIKIKRINPNIFIIAFIMDNPFPSQGSNWKRFQKAIPFYDLHFVIRNDDIQKLKNKRAKHILRFHKGYDPKYHRPLLNEKKIYDVFFAGRWEKKREADLAYLIKNGISVTVAGSNDWKRKGRFWKLIKNSFIEGGLYGHDYAKALNSSKIAICFYSSWNRDKENSRMYEITACETFILAESNDENTTVFEQGKEAEFFSSSEELLQKVSFYLNNKQQRKRIANAGRQRCLNSKYCYRDRIKNMLEITCEIKN